MWLPSHLVVIPLSYLLVFLLAARSRALTARERALLLRVLFALMLFSEVIKQALGILGGSYSAGFLPFHYSSTYYVSIGLYAFGNGRWRHYGQCSLLVGGVLLLISMTCCPFLVVGDCTHVFRSFAALHSLFYHVAALLGFAVMLANGEYAPRRHDTLRYLSFLFAWAALALPVARATGINYAGLLRSYIPLLEKLRLARGDLVYLITYALLASALAVLILHTYAQLYRRVWAEGHGK